MFPVAADSGISGLKTPRAAPVPGTPKLQLAKQGCPG